MNAVFLDELIHFISCEQEWGEKVITGRKVQLH